MGETGRAFRIRLNEHRKETEQMSSKKFTQETRKVSVDEIHKSAITDHVAQHNHVIDWVGAKVIDKDSNKQTRWIHEAIRIRQEGSTSHQP